MTSQFWISWSVSDESWSESEKELHQFETIGNIGGLSRLLIDIAFGIVQLGDGDNILFPELNMDSISTNNQAKIVGMPVSVFDLAYKLDRNADLNAISKGRDHKFSVAFEDSALRITFETKRDQMYITTNLNKSPALICEPQSLIVGITTFLNAFAAEAFVRLPTLAKHAWFRPLHRYYTGHTIPDQP